MQSIVDSKQNVMHFVIIFSLCCHDITLNLSDKLKVEAKPVNKSLIHSVCVHQTKLYIWNDLDAQLSVYSTDLLFSKLFSNVPDVST